MALSQAWERGKEKGPTQRSMHVYKLQNLSTHKLKALALVGRNRQLPHNIVVRYERVNTMI